jgi:RNA polymerase sigma-70 factor (ECF subfamily)
LANVVRKAQGGDRTAYKVLYEQHAEAMFNICIKMSGDYQIAQDILQDAFVIGFQNLHQLKDQGKFSGWLKRIVINECIRHSKAKFTNVEFLPDSIEVDDVQTESVLNNISFEQINKAIQNLPEGYRQVFTLYVIEDYTHKEIASLMNISESTSKSQYHYARQALKKSLSKYYQNG